LQRWVWNGREAPGNSECRGLYWEGKRTGRINKGASIRNQLITGEKRFLARDAQVLPPSEALEKNWGED